ncbi:MAG: hypothetical protein LC102_06735 [Ignavibacteriales bacterium]|nr:MAG: hypothetical protein F9K26_11775 [Ignavibacteriaceae bacterium]MBW7874005.1 hypothetical protein [Ignavibacteria bacterium]MCZ2143105.1 hypothetical protein [Ignavibacteriales bacterium]OQY75734.1 MAG: hypothetical protein B6D45_05270 [Ignavibacteriales bacterium UTCHB3]MBV6443986.1 hypothetical protein [Ignavibacteriaceae bacterium]
MNSERTTLFVIGAKLSNCTENFVSSLPKGMSLVHVGTDPEELKQFSSGRKLIVNGGIRDFYTDDSVLFVNQKEFDNLLLAIEYFLKDQKAMICLFATGDPLSLAITPMLARVSDEKDIDASFLGVKTEEEDRRITEETLNYFLKNRYRLYLLEREDGDFSLQANEEKINDTSFKSVINLVVKSFKQAE